MSKNSNFEKWTVEEMRKVRREWISYYLQQGFTTLGIIKRTVRRRESWFYGLELKRYYYYEYH